MTLAVLLTIVAIIVAPFLAVFAQRQIDIWREGRARRLWIFKTLMATRGMPLSPDHVQALNMIALEFASAKDDGVRRSWKEYFDHLCSVPAEGDQLEQRQIVWGQRKDDLFASLLGTMGKALGYDFDPVELKKGVYAPQAHAVTELEQQAIRKGLLELVSGKRSLHVVRRADDSPE